MAKNKSEKIIIQVQVKDNGVSAKIGQVTKAKKQLSDQEKINLKIEKQLNAEKEREKVLNNENYVALQKLKIANQNLAKEKKNLALQTNKNTEATIKGKTQTGLNNAILTEAGRTASDAAYGMQGMSNNLGQLLTLMNQHVQTKGGFIASMKSLVKSIWGVQGILIGLQLLISFLPRIQKHFESAGKKAKRFAEELEKQKQEISTLEAVSKNYVEVLTNVNSSEEQRKKTIEELQRLIPTLKDEDFKYGNNLEKVTEKINLYVLSQASRIEIDKLTEENSKILTKSQDIRRIKSIKDEKKRLDAMKEFLKEEKGGFSERNKQIAMAYGQTGIVATTLKTSSEITKEFTQRTKQELSEAQVIFDRINELTKNIISPEGKDPSLERKENLDRLLKSIEDSSNKIQDDSLSKRLQRQRDNYAQQLKDLGNFDEQKINKLLQFLDDEIAIVVQKEKEKEQAKLAAAEEARQSYLDADAFDETTIEGLIAKLNYKESLEIKAETQKYEKLKAIAEANNLDTEQIDEQHKQNKEAIAKKYGDKEVEIENMVQRAKTKAITDFISGSAALFEKGSKKYKVVAATGATVDALASSVADFKAAAKSPAAVGNPAYPYLRASKALLKGYGTVKKILATNKPNTSGDGGSSSAPAPIPPDFNIVGSTGTNQLAEAIGSTTQQPVKAFVVSSEVSTAQQLDRNRVESASI